MNSSTVYISKHRACAELSKIRAADQVERSGYVKRDDANSLMQVMGVNLRVQHENTMRCDKPSVTDLVNRTEVPL